jgi:hypothetical protein
MRSSDGGLVAALYAPCTVDTTVRGHKVALKVETDYPFKQTVRISVNPQSPVNFPMRLRIPAWAHGAVISINRHTLDIKPQPQTFAVIDRLWQPGDRIELNLPMVPTVSRWFHNSLALTRGPLVFSLDPGESWVKLRDRGMTADWQVYPTGYWNYALALDEQTASQVQVVEREVPPRPFAAAATAVSLRVQARRLDSWRSEDGVAAPIPKGLQSSSLPEQTLELIPYGAAKLRVTAFPQLSRAHDSKPVAST